MSRRPLDLVLAKNEINLPGLENKIFHLCCGAIFHTALTLCHGGAVRMTVFLRFSLAFSLVTSPIGNPFICSY
jgi:hypothetical protein